MPEPAFPDRQTVYFATNRNRLANDAGYGPGFYDGDPRLIRLGEVAMTRAGGAWRMGPVRTYAERSRAKPDAERGERDWTILGSEEAFGTMREAGLAGACADILVFLHGAANSFDDSIVAAARLAELYSGERPLLPFVFSYPANGTADPLNYFSDRADATISGRAVARAYGRLVSFLAKWRLEQRCNQRIHLLAHSLGNYALRVAVQFIATDPALRRLRLFDSVILAHADDDEDTLTNAEKMRFLARLADRITVYFDPTDKLMKLSDAVHMDRLGQKGPTPFPGPELDGCRIEAVDCRATAFDIADDPQRHRHYRLSSAVVSDIRAVLAGAVSPGRSPGPAEGLYAL